MNPRILVLGPRIPAADVGATRKILVAPVAAPYPLRYGIDVMGPPTAVRLLAEQ